MAIFDIQFPEEQNINAEFRTNPESTIEFNQSQQVEASLDNSETFEVEEFNVTDENGLYFQFDNTGSGGTNNYNELINKPVLNGVQISGSKLAEDYGIVGTNTLAQIIQELRLEMPKIYFDVTANWDAMSQAISEENSIYIYLDHQTYSGKNVAGVKVGDGTSTIPNLPFTDVLMTNHINNGTVHITQAERDFWNNKVRCYYTSPTDEILVFTTN